MYILVFLRVFLAPKWIRNHFLKALLKPLSKLFFVGMLWAKNNFRLGTAEISRQKGGQFCNNTNKTAWSLPRTAVSPSGGSHRRSSHLNVNSPNRTLSPADNHSHRVYIPHIYHIYTHICIATLKTQKSQLQQSKEKSFQIFTSRTQKKELPKKKKDLL